LKFGIFTNPKRPKISQDRIFKLTQLAGVTYSAKDPDIVIVVGGDGTFGYYGRILSIPMLFVGVNDPELLGSKARLAEIFYDDLEKALHDINLGKYTEEERKMFSVNFGKNKSTTAAHDVLTDIYLERGAYSGCIRYTVSISYNRSYNKNYCNTYRNSFLDENYIIEHAIGNGVIISSSFGSKGTG
jgi:NAD kinase